MEHQEDQLRLFYSQEEVDGQYKAGWSWGFCIGVLCTAVPTLFLMYLLPRYL